MIPIKMHKYFKFLFKEEMFTFEFGTSIFDLYLQSYLQLPSISKSISGTEHFSTELVNRGTHFKYSTYNN